MWFFDPTRHWAKGIGKAYTPARLDVVLQELHEHLAAYGHDIRWWATRAGGALGTCRDCGGTARLELDGQNIPRVLAHGAVAAPGTGDYAECPPSPHRRRCGTWPAGESAQRI